MRPYKDKSHTSDVLFEFVRSDLKGINIDLISTEELAEERSSLSKRFESCKTLVGTQTLHYFIPVSENALMVKDYSFSFKPRIVFCVRSTSSTNTQHIHGYIAVEYDKCFMQVLREIFLENIN